MLEAYFDESERTEGTFCVAGYAFAPAQAKKLEKEWTRLLGHRKPFHMTDVVALQQQFRDLSRHQANRLIRDAVVLVTSRMSFGVAVSCDLAEIRGLAPVVPGLSSEYAVCCHVSMIMLSKQVREERRPDRISYTFEAGHRDEGLANLYLTRQVADLVASHSDQYRYHSHAFVPKTDSSALQAADMLAWEWTKYRAETLKLGIRPMRGSLRALFVEKGPPDRYILKHLSGTDLKRYASEVSQVFGVEGKPGLKKPT